MPDVLFVEDDERIRELYAEMLRQAGLDVVEHPLAEDALGHLRQHRPDVILLDLGMPAGTMSGLELLARLRENVAWAAIPVVVLSGFGDAVNPDLVGRLGIRQVLTKGAIRASDVTDAVLRAIRR